MPEASSTIFKLQFFWFHHSDKYICTVCPVQGSVTWQNNPWALFTRHKPFICMILCSLRAQGNVNLLFHVRSRGLSPVISLENQKKKERKFPFAENLTDLFNFSRIPSKMKTIDDNFSGLDMYFSFQEVKENRIQQVVRQCKRY